MTYHHREILNGVSAGRVRKKIDPLSGESPRGYLRRVARFFHYSSPLWLLEIAGMGFGDFNSPEYEQIVANTLRLTVHEWRTVACYTRDQPLHARTRPSFLGNIIGSEHFTYKYPKVCIRCVREQFVEKSIWEVALVTSCPTHRCLLIDSCPACGAYLSRGRPKFLLCTCGQDIRRLRPTPADQRRILVSALIEDAVGDSHHADRIAKRLRIPKGLSTLDVGDLLELIQSLGLSEEDGRLKNRRSHFEANDLTAMQECCSSAVAFLTNWPNSFCQILERTAANRRRGTREQSVRCVFGWFYRVLFGALRGEQFRFLHEAFAGFVLHKWTGPIKKNAIWLRYADREPFRWCGIKEAKKLLHCKHPERLVPEAKVRGFVHLSENGVREWWFNKQSILDFRSQISTSGIWISFKELRSLLDAPVRLTRELVSAGLIARQSVGGNRVRYDRRHALQLLDTFARNKAPKQTHQPAGHVTLREANRRSVLPHAAFVPFVRAVIAGALSPVSRTRKQARLMDYVFGEQDLIRIAKLVLKGSTECVNVTQTARILQTSPRKVKGLLDDGVLIPIHRDRHGINIPSSQVRDFWQKFVSLESIAAALKRPCKAIISEAKSRGVPLLQVGGMNQFVVKKSVAKLFRHERR
jgi:hypothetical protein